MTLENGKFGQLNDDDPYYGSKIIDIVASSLKNADIDPGMGIYGIETPTRSPRLHKIRIHTSYRDGETGLITWAIISIKETISSTDRVGVRHRLKSYINVPDLESGMEHRTGYGGSVDEQRLQLQRLLARGLKNKEPYQQQMGGLEMFCVPVGSPSADNVMRYMSRHPEHLLTSIYYGFRPQDVTHEPTSLEDGKTPIGGTVLFAARM